MCRKSSGLLVLFWVLLKVTFLSSIYVAHPMVLFLSMNHISKDHSGLSECKHCGRLSQSCTHWACFSRTMLFSLAKGLKQRIHKVGNEHFRNFDVKGLVGRIEGSRWFCALGLIFTVTENRGMEWTLVVNFSCQTLCTWTHLYAYSSKAQRFCQLAPNTKYLKQAWDQLTTWDQYL